MYNNKNNCILITNNFPYDKGETFLQDEIHYLSNVFNEIHIFSINAKIEDRVNYSLPENIICHPLGKYSGKFKFILFLLKGMGKYDDKWKPAKGILNALASFYARGRARDISDSIISIIKNKKIDIEYSTIYSYWFTYHAVSAVMIKDKLNLKNKIKLISRAHGYDLYSERNRINFLPYQKTLLQELDGVYPCSLNGKKYLIDKYGCDFKNINVARLGTTDRGLASWKDGTRIFVTCSNLIPLKRVEVFAEAFCRLVNNGIDCKWICIGSGSEEKTIKSIIEKNQCNKNVEFTGWLKKEDIINYYVSNNIYYFVNVSQYEGVPVSIMEAFSFGIPAIATNVGGTGELVNNENGIIISDELSIEGLYSILLQELNLDYDRYLEKRNNARKTWEQLSDASINYTKFANDIIYSE